MKIGKNFAMERGKRIYITKEHARTFFYKLK